MKVIVLLLQIIILFLNTACINMDVWEKISSTIITKGYTTYTGATYLGGNNNFMISYINNGSTFFQNLLSGAKIEVDDKITPTSLCINNAFNIIFTEKNNIYTNINSNFSKIETNVLGTKSIIGYLNSDNELVVGFMGTDTVILYSLVDLKLTPKKKYNLEGNEIISLHTDFINHVNYIHLLMKKNNEYMFSLYSLEDNEPFMIFNVAINVELYDYTDFYKRIVNNQTPLHYIFSYDKKGKNFVFFLSVYIDNDYFISNFRNKYNFLPFQNAIIIQAFFLPNTEYLYYLIEIENQRYAGVFDVVNDIIVFNFKTNTEFISYQGYFLLYSENNIVYRLCPFNTKDGNKCDLYSDNTRLLIKITSENEIITKCTSDAPYTLRVYCYDKCPLGYYSSEFVCEKCHIFDNDEKECVESCEEDKIFDELNKICYSCKQFNQYKNKELNMCVDDCFFFNLVKDGTNYVCKSCQELGQYWKEGKCVDDCGTSHFADENKKICIKCSKEAPYFQKGKCVKKCSENYTLDEKSKKCILCSSKKPFLQDGKCVEKCDSFHKIDLTNKICINCKNDTNGPFLQNNECVEKCEKNYKIDEKNKICINCQENSPDTPFLEDNQCVEKCKNYYIKDINLMRCYNCTELGNDYYFYNETCIKGCPQNYLKDNINKICYKCGEGNSKKIYYEDGKCVEDCSQYYLKNDNDKTCINCTQLNPDYYFQDNLCVKNCNKYYVKDNELKVCINCSVEYRSNLPYFMENKCVSECNEKYAVDEINKICYKCQDNKPYVENGKCVEKCSPYRVIDNKNFLCINCEAHNNTFYEDKKCVEKCSPGYMVAPFARVCMHCYNEYKKYEYKGQCFSECPEHTVNNPNVNQCQACFIVDYSKPFYDELNKKCVDDCPEGTEKDSNNFICIKCLNYYDNITRKCVNECPPGSFIEGNICQKCNIYDVTKKACVSECSSGYYPYYIQSGNYSLCYEGFCGFGICSLNESNYKDNKSNIYLNNLYYCDCQNENVFGKYCQYKRIKFYENDIAQIKPLQDIVYANKKNIYTVEFIDNENKNSNFLRQLSTNHSQNINRRIKYYVRWTLFQINCAKYQNQDIIASTDLYFIIDPDILTDDCENIIHLLMTDENNYILANNRLDVKTKSLKPEKFYLVISTSKALSRPLDKASPYKIKLVELSENNDNYIYKYLCITEEGEEYSLTNYMKNDDIYDNYALPYCSNLKARIKNDFGNTIDIISERVLFKNEQYKDLPSIIGNYNLFSDKMESIFKLIMELKTFFSLYNYENNNYLDNNLSEEKEYLDAIITFLGIHLPESIINENQILNSNYSLDDIDNRIEPNAFISIINQLALYYYNKYINYFYIFEDSNYTTIYMDIKDIIYNSLNNPDITSLSKDTILSYFRTIDNLITIMETRIIFITYNISELYDCINILKNLLLKNITSGTNLKLNGNNMDIYLLKPGYYTEEIAIEKDKINEENSEYDFMQYKNYKIENKYIKNINSFDSFFNISKENYDYLYDEITYLKHESITDLIISVMKINKKKSFIANWNIITNNSYVKNQYSMPNILDSSFIIEIQNPKNGKVLENLKSFRYNISFEISPILFELYKENISCLALHSLIIKDDNINISNEGKCLTYLVSNNKIICDCNTDGEIVILWDSVTTSLSNKVIMYEKINYKYKLINSISGSIILSSLALITFFSISFIFYEFYEEKKNIHNILNPSIRVQKEYDYFNRLRRSGKCIFALYILYFKYSFLNVFSTYKYNHPRYIRFYYEIIKILLNILLSLIPIYYFCPYEISSNYPYTSDYFTFNFFDSLKSFLYSFAASIIIFLVFLVVNKIFDFRHMRRLIWKPRKDIIKYWVYGYFKKEPMFHRKLHRVKVRMLAFANLCGRYVLKNKPKDKYAYYLEYKISSQNPNASISDYDFNSYPYYKVGTSTNFSNNKIPIIKDKFVIKYQTDKNLKTNLYKDFDIDNKNENININKKLFITKGCKPFMLSSTAKANHISMWNIYRIESVKNRYMFINRDYYRNASSQTIKYINLNIQTLNNYTYMLSNDLYYNKLNQLFGKSKITIIRFMNFLLFFTLLIIDVGIVILVSELYEQYENYLIMNWLIPVLVQIIIFNFVINFIFALFSTFLLFTYYKTKKYNCVCNCIFNIFVEKYMKYLFKIRTLIKKYYKDFENMK